MSLVIDNLKKLKKQSGDAGVPPGLINLAPRQRSKGPSRILLLLLAVSLAGGAYVFFFMDTDTAVYRPAPPVRTAAAPKPAPKPTPQPAPVQRQPLVMPVPAPQMPAVNEADIKARIEAAVKEAMQDAEKRRMQTPAEPEQKTPETVQPPMKMAEVQMPVPAAEKQAEAVAESVAVKPVMSDEQRREFDKKIEYNTITATADRALADRNYAKAAEYYRKALSLKPSSANLANLLTAKIGLGDPDSVDGLLKTFRSSVDDRAISAAALEMSRVGYPEKGLLLLEKYTGEFDTDGRLYYAAGQVQETRGDTLRAENAYKRASSMFPADPYYAYAYARMLDTNEKYDEAVVQYRKAASLNPDGEIASNAASRASAITAYLERVKEAAKN